MVSKKYTTRSLSLALVAGLLALTAACAPAEAERDDPVASSITRGALVVDVRTPQEFQSGHYPGALNIPLQEVPARLDEFGARSAPIVVYCRSGNRSGQARRILADAGFTSVLNGGGLHDMPTPVPVR